MLKIILVLCGLIHAIPVLGVLGPDWLETLYGVTGMSNDTTTLMQHRAIMFAVVALLCFLGAFNIKYQNIASLLVMISMCGYLWLVGFDNENPKLLKVLWIDSTLIILLTMSWLWQCNTNSIKYVIAQRGKSLPPH